MCYRGRWGPGFPDRDILRFPRRGHHHHLLQGKTTTYLSPCPAGTLVSMIISMYCYAIININFKLLFVSTTSCSRGWFPMISLTSVINCNYLVCVWLQTLLICFASVYLFIFLFLLFVFSVFRCIGRMLINILMIYFSFRSWMHIKAHFVSYMPVTTSHLLWISTFFPSCQGMTGSTSTSSWSALQAVAYLHFVDNDIIIHNRGQWPLF